MDALVAGGNVVTPRSGSARVAAFAVGLVASAFAALAFPAATPAAPSSQDPGFRRFEASAGFGGASSFENDIFNLPVDNGSTPDLTIDFRLRQNFSDRLAIGFHVYGNNERTPDYIATDSLGFVLGTFHYRLTVLHVGFDARYLFLAPPFQPFVEAGVNYVSGTVDSRDFGNLQLNGVGLGGGAGVQYRIVPALAVGAQGLFAIGTAKWEKLPFPGLSTSRDFDPGFAGAEGFVTWRWGVANH